MKRSCQGALRDVEVMVEDALVGLWRWLANRAVLPVRDLEATVLESRCPSIWNDSSCNIRAVVKVHVRLDA